MPFSPNQAESRPSPLHLNALIPYPKPRWLPLFGAVCGTAWALNRLALSAALNADMDLSLGTLIGLSIFGALLGALLCMLLQAGTGQLAGYLDAESRHRYLKWDPLTYTPGLMVFFGAVGVHFPPLVLILAAIVLGKFFLLFILMKPVRRNLVTNSMGYVAFLFLISGFAALIYQIAWQRTLFSAFGVNIESTTLIVSLFMFGLGLGAIIGGLLSRRYPGHAAVLFFWCEVGIGLFGIISLPLIGLVADATLHGSVWQIALSVFGLLCIPTVLMGATLPILVSHLYQHLRNVGKSVGLLYCINTLGSAIACFLTVDLLFALLGKSGAVCVAACCNLLVGYLVWRYARRLALAQTTAKAAAEPSGPMATAARVDTEHGAHDRVPAKSGTDSPSWRRNAFAVIFALAAGYISLSQEIVWMRVVGYMTGGSPTVFGHVLGFFLLGVSLGSFWAERLCDRWGRSMDLHSPVRFVGSMLALSGLFYYFSIVIVSWVHAWSNPVGLLLAHLLVSIVSFLLGGLFPVLCHYGAKTGKHPGVAVSRLYLANIAGATLGPLVTAFVLMDLLPLDRIILVLSVAALVLAGLVFSFGAPRQRTPLLLTLAGAIVLGVWFHQPLYTGLLERLQFEGPTPTYRHLKQTRSGVIAVVPDEELGDIIYGGGIYDGRFNIDPVVDSNVITRCYMIAALHPAPTDVLEVGLSGASWTRVMADYEPIQRLTVVEINPGYLEVVRNYHEQAAALLNPKVAVHIDDGRRWLNRNPDARFDLIVQNTTFHWRDHATNVLSAEYLRLCKSRLKPGGVVYINTTGSIDVAWTAAAVFRYVVRYRNFVAASDSPFSLPPESVRNNLLRFVRDNAPVFALDNAHRRKLEELALTELIDIAPELRQRSRGRYITDDNMRSEFNMHNWLSRGATWQALWSGDSR